MIVKPKNEAVSFGLKVVNDEDELRQAAKVIFDEFGQAVLAEQFIDGREINVGLLGNNPPEAFPPVELSFGKDGPQIYTYEDKTGRSGRAIEPICPAPIGEELTHRAQELAVKAFKALGLYDCARVDMRLDKQNRVFILETNSLPSLGEHGSYLVGAAQVGLDFTKFVNRLVDVASTRYFGMAAPPPIDKKSADPKSHVRSYVTQRRDQMERRVREWVNLSSKTSDPVGCLQAAERAGGILRDLGMKPCAEFTDKPEVWTWETAKGFAGGTLFVVNLDVPVDLSAPHQPFRRDPESLYGEGVGSSRAPLVMLEYALRSLRSIRRLRQLHVGVLLYTDEGREAQTSDELIRAAAEKAKRVLVLRPGTPTERMILRRRGNRKFRLSLQSQALAPGRATEEQAMLRSIWAKLDRFAQLSSQKDRTSVSILELRTQRHPLRLPHRVTATILVTYLDPADADRLEAEMRSILGKGGAKWQLVLDSDRPPMRERPLNTKLFKELVGLAAERGFTLKRDTSTWSSVAGLVPSKVACVCGVGPVTRDRGTPQEHVLRISLIQRTLLLAEYLAALLQEETTKPRRTAMASAAGAPTRVGESQDS